MKCPIVTGDAKLNAANKKKAIEKADYMEADDDAEYKCENCAAFVQSDEMQGCLENGIAKDMEDKAEDMGYCAQLDFVCSEDMVCSKWLGGQAKRGGIVIKIAGMMDE
jgi:hypothetical protein